MNTKIIYQPTGKAREYAELAANLYSGCSHGCAYCFGPSVMRQDKERFHSEIAPRKDILKRLEDDCKKLIDVDIPPVLLSFVTDPYQPIEAGLRITRRALELFDGYDVAFTILTKGGMLAARDFDLYGPGDSFGVTLTANNNQAEREWEPNAAPTNERIRALKLAKEQGVNTWVSLEPVVYPVYTLELIRKTHEFVDHYKVGKLNYHPWAKNVNWKEATLRITNLLDELGKDYYIKEDLRAYLPEVSHASD